MEEKDSKKDTEEVRSDRKDSSGDESKSPNNDLPTKLTEAENQLAYYKDLFLRKAAEFDNFKRRSETEAMSVIKFANEDLVLAVLPIVDDLERSLKKGTEAKDSPFYKGIELIYQKMLKILESQDVRPFETVGKEFDVHYHDALLQVHKEGVPPHTILEEVEKGYLFHEKVLRHAKVVVSAAVDSEQPVDAANNKGDAPNEG